MLRHFIAFGPNQNNVKIDWNKIKEIENSYIEKYRIVADRNLDYYGLAYR